jgi:hypothetical protein
MKNVLVIASMLSIAAGTAVAADNTQCSTINANATALGQHISEEIVIQELAKVHSLHKPLLTAQRSLAYCRDNPGGTITDAMIIAVAANILER